jgi:hypothetical protein
MPFELTQALSANNPDSLRRLIQAEGRWWAQFSETELIGLVAWHGEDRVREAAAAEIRRRGIVADAEHASKLITFAEETSKQTDQLIVATDASSDCANQQNEQMIKLTDATRLLTWVLVAVGVVQIALMVWK